MKRTFLALALMGCASEGPIGVNEVGAGWLEVYSADENASLDGWTLTPEGQETWEVPAGQTVEAQGLLVIYFSGELGDLVADFTLPPSGSGLVVRDGDGEIVQEISVPELDSTESYGRIPDGAANWQIIAEPSPGALNAP